MQSNVLSILKRLLKGFHKKLFRKEGMIIPKPGFNYIAQKRGSGGNENVLKDTIHM